jgi:integrase
MEAPFQAFRGHVGSETILAEELLAEFGLAHAGPRGPRTWTDQASDYHDKIAILATAFRRRSGRHMVVDDLLGPAVDELLAQRQEVGRPLRATSRNAYRRIVRSFATWLVQSQQFPTCPRPICLDEREETSAPVYFETGELRVLFEHLANRDEVCDRRTTAAAMIALDTSARASDVASILVSQLDRDARTVTMDRKNSVQSTLPVSIPTWNAIDRYLAARAVPRGALFLTDDEQSTLTGKALSKHFTAAVKRSGIRRVGDARADKMTFHALRRSFVRAAAKVGMSVGDLSAFTGWDPDYAHQVMAAYRVPDLDDLRALQAVASPLLAVFGSSDAASRRSEGRRPRQGTDGVGVDRPSVASHHV